MLKNRIEILQHAFDTDHVNYWSNLSRINNLLVIMNISMFFLTGLVAKGYFYTCYSLVCLGAVGMGVLVPTTMIRNLWYYWIFLVVELSGLYFLVASVIFWVKHGSG
ncbi:hypothetical protein [Desulfosarcina sp.]|uniref:hypothetical protein n=1 Tax=Desulfosarcina sp. TaxID=2027861 RepID=UPI0029BE00F4|nr:hypothetical protein [Desulfosarcina sp.]MDX2451059.1 hypothetical protein [Desulfosarcina sp.]MDX2488886.1 hypothetical protein [Desulfosarcina sp.]